MCDHFIIISSCFILLFDVDVKMEDLKRCKEQKEKIQVFFENVPSYLVVAAVAKDTKKNSIIKITCKKGIPLGGYVYDNQADAYQYECFDCLHLGVIPVSAFITLKDNPFWQIKVPIAESVLKKHLSDIQKKELKNFRNYFSVDEFDLHFIQMVSPN
jgi:hypothetical protein